MMIKTAKINKEIEIEDLVKILPKSVSYLMEKGIRCLRCGEPLWGSLESAALDKGFSNEELQEFVKELNKMLVQSE